MADERTAPAADRRPEPGDHVVIVGEPRYLGFWTAEGAPGVVEGVTTGGRIRVRTTTPDCDHNQTLTFAAEELRVVAPGASS